MSCPKNVQIWPSVWEHEHASALSSCPLTYKHIDNSTTVPVFASSVCSQPESAVNMRLLLSHRSSQVLSLNWSRSYLHVICFCCHTQSWTAAKKRDSGVYTVQPCLDGKLGRRRPPPSLRHVAARHAKYFSVKLHGRSGNSWRNCDECSITGKRVKPLSLLVPPLKEKQIYFPISYIFTLITSPDRPAWFTTQPLDTDDLMVSMPSMEKRACSSSGIELSGMVCSDIKSCSNFLYEWMNK